MPRYCYNCTECGISLEVFHSSSERLIFCEHCKQETLKKVLSQVNIIKPSNTNGTKQPVGSLVNEEIQKAKEELKDYKKQLSKEVT